MAVTERSIQQSLCLWRYDEACPQIPFPRDIHRHESRRWHNLYRRISDRGCIGAGAESVGLNIDLPHEQAPNPFLTDSVDFKYFFVRKVMLVKYSTAFIASSPEE